MRLKDEVCQAVTVIASRVCEDKSFVFFRGLPARQLTRLGVVEPRLLLHFVDTDSMVISCFVIAMISTPPCS